MSGTAMVVKPAITIRAPKAILKAWLDALRSGKYAQGEGYLAVDGKYCCLGVLQMVVDGKVEMQAPSLASFLPSYGWLESKGIEFITNSAYAEGDGASPLIPSVTSKYGTSMEISACNDGCLINGVDRRWSFAEIADLIEKHSEGY